MTSLFNAMYDRRSPTEQLRDNLINEHLNTDLKIKNKIQKGGFIFLDSNRKQPHFNYNPQRSIYPRNYLLYVENIGNTNNTRYILSVIRNIGSNALTCKFILTYNLVNNRIIFPQPNVFNGLKYKSIYKINSNNWNSENFVFLKAKDEFVEALVNQWFFRTVEGRLALKYDISPNTEERGPPQGGGVRKSLSNKDFKKILKFYKLSIPKTRKKIKKKAIKTLTDKYCSCLNKVKRKSKTNGREIGICTSSVINKKGFKRGKFTCKKKGSVDFYKGGKRKTRKKRGGMLCPICQETISEGRSMLRGLIDLKCNHRFHKKCIKQSLEHGINTCPTCRHPIDDDIRVSLGLTPLQQQNLTPLQQQNLNALYQDFNINPENHRFPEVFLRYAIARNTWPIAFNRDTEMMIMYPRSENDMFELDILNQLRNLLRRHEYTISISLANDNDYIRIRQLLYNELKSLFDYYIVSRRERNITRISSVYRVFVDTIQNELDGGILGQGIEAIEEMNNLLDTYPDVFTIPPNHPTNSNEALVGGKHHKKKTRKKKTKKRKNN